MRGTWTSGERGWNLLGWTICLLQIATLTIVSLRYDVDSGPLLVCACACAAVVLALGVALWLRTREGRGYPTLTWPLVAVAVYAAFGFVASEATAVLPGMVTFTFAYIGLTQRRWTSCWFLALAIPAYVIGSGGPGSTTWTTLPLLVAMWLFIGEVPAALLERLRQQSAQLARMASTDSLTGLLNRSALVDELAQTSPADTVVIIDLDAFKRHNDQYGHVSGDGVLSELATALAAVPGGRWFRYGGDEFVGIFADRDEASTRVLVDGVRGLQEQAEFSAGCAPGGPGALERADADLYRVKDSRRPS